MTASPARIPPVLRTAWALLASLCACVSAPIAVPSDPASPTGGLAMQLWLARTDTKQYQAFRVAADGAFSYGGGMKAFDRQYEWQGRLTDDEARQLRAIVDRAAWLTAKDPSREGSATTIAEVAVGNGAGERSFTIAGRDEAVDQVEALLSKAASRRFDRYMQRLPDAGPQPR